MYYQINFCVILICENTLKPIFYYLIQYIFLFYILRLIKKNSQQKLKNHKFTSVLLLHDILIITKKFKN